MLWQRVFCRLEKIHQIQPPHFHYTQARHLQLLLPLRQTHSDTITETIIVFPKLTTIRLFHSHYRQQSTTATTTSKSVTTTIRATTRTRAFTNLFKSSNSLHPLQAQPPAPTATATQNLISFNTSLSSRTPTLTCCHCPCSVTITPILSSFSRQLARSRNVTLFANNRHYCQVPLLLGSVSRSHLSTTTNNTMALDSMDNVVTPSTPSGGIATGEGQVEAMENSKRKEFSYAITKNMRDEWRHNFFDDPKNKVALQACSKLDPLEVCLSRSGIEDTNNVFTHKIEQEGKPVSNQKSSGRCWLFAFLNSVRVPFMKQYNIDEFEFSQSHLFFWDKIERCNHHLNNVAKAFRKGETLDSRLLAFLLQDPISDGGQWGMVVNLVREYGLMPKKNFPESFSSESSMRMNTILRSKLREFSKEIHDLLKANGSDADAKELIAKQMSQIYRIVGICLGVPKDEFVWEYYDKSKAYHKVGPITSKQFYEEYVKPTYDVENKICLVHDPRPNNPYSRTYVVQYLGNMVTGNPTIYNNQPVDLLVNLTADAIKAGELVWFGCEVSKRFAAKQGIEDLEIHDYKSVFGVDVALGLQKADRLLYLESCMSHAMVFTGVSVDENEIPTKFRVENSWGDDRGDKGYLVMTADWFREFVFEVVIDKMHLPADVIATSLEEPTVLPPWDPMGTLACKNCSDTSEHL